MLWRKKMQQHNVLRCSFCNKDQNDVQKLIAGPPMLIRDERVDLFICNECVEVCNDIIGNDDRVSRAGALGVKKSEGPLSWPNAIRCALCHVELQSGEGVLVTGNRRTLCRECVKAVAMTEVKG